MEKKDELETLLDLGIKFFAELSKYVEKYNMYFEMVNNADKATQDLLHKLELGKVEEGESKLKILTQITNTRKDRRYYKDKVECLEQIITIYQANTKIINQLKNQLGVSNKKYTSRENRKYKPKIFVDMKVN